MKRNVAMVKRMAKTIEPQVRALLLATVYAKAERERVDVIQRAILAERVYPVDAKNIERGRGAERVTDPRLSYLMSDADAADYFAKCNAAHLANGYAKAAEGFCPALVAAHDQTKAEWALITAAEEFFPEITNDKLLCGITRADGSRECGLETRRKYLDLLTGLVVNQSGFKA
jgi:hypothetical protein